MSADDPIVTELLQKMAGLERRVTELEDERQLRDLLARYSFGADVYRDERWVELFTADGRYDLGAGNVEGAYNGRFEGRGELLDLITGPGMPPADHSQHHHGPMSFEFDPAHPDEAGAQSYSITFLESDAGTTVYCAGFNRWRFRRVEGRWRIAERHRREIGTGRQAEVID
jgi:hypothetical protein